MTDLEEIARQYELNLLKKFKDKQLIKVVTGIRRCGKSTLLDQFKKFLMAEGVAENQIVHINFEDFENRSLLNLEIFFEFVKSKIIPEKKMYLFFDEIQQVQDFQKVVDSFYIKENIDIYITGSNSRLLSGELATLLSGRYIEIKLQPFSFAEFLKATGKKNLPAAYKNYIETSSFPYTVRLKDEESVHTYLEGIYNSILVKDIISRKNISDVKILQSITEFVFDNIGLEVSSKKIADTLTSSGRKMDSRTVESYLSALSESFIVYKASRYNIKGKEHLKLLEKYYVCDIGLRRFLLGKKINGCRTHSGKHRLPGTFKARLQGLHRKNRRCRSRFYSHESGRKPLCSGFSHSPGRSNFRTGVKTIETHKRQLPKAAFDIG